jgi:hypothetical protein
LRKKSHLPGVGGNHIETGSLARVRNNERERDNNALVDVDVPMHSTPPPASHRQHGGIGNSLAIPGGAGGGAVLLSCIGPRSGEEELEVVLIPWNPYVYFRLFSCC